MEERPNPGDQIIHTRIAPRQGAASAVHAVSGVSNVPSERHINVLQSLCGAEVTSGQSARSVGRQRQAHFPRRAGEVADDVLRPVPPTPPMFAALSNRCAYTVRVMAGLMCRSCRATNTTSTPGRHDRGTSGSEELRPANAYWLAATFLRTTSLVLAASSVGLNSMTSVPSKTTGVCPGGA